MRVGERWVILSNLTILAPQRYTQVPGDRLSLSMCPHRRRWTGGFDAAALLRNKSWLTTVLSVPHVQIVIVALGLLQTGVGLQMLGAKVHIVPNAHCAKVGVSFHSAHRQIQVHASGWHFGLLLNRCKVPGGERSSTNTSQVLTFTDNVDFNGFYFTPTITSVDHKGVTCYGLRGRGVESRSLMTSVETRDLSGEVDRSRVNSNTKRVGKSRHVDGGMFTTVAILNEKSFDP